MHGTDEVLDDAWWPRVLDSIAAGDHRMYIQARDGGRVVVLAESELQQLEAELHRLRGQLSPERATPAINRLTAREAETLQLVAEGLSGTQIAERLQRSSHTVAQHLATVRRKYGVRSSVAAVEAARRAGHLPPGEEDHLQQRTQ
ncbi:response regulator transcription factor [Kineococcus sp. GCM10028916]|uniref:response regulator transcription factor n=1 Tax=Kineococcus sp. GCM10028916 TaxID=3273394 RepID=UPI0036346AAA